MKSLLPRLLPILAILAAGAASALAAPAMTVTNVDVRSGPGFEEPIVGYLPAQTAVDAQCNEEHWCQVSGAGLSGWVHAMALGIGSQGIGQNPPPPNPPRPQPLPQPVPWPQPQPPRPLPPPVYEEAGACFYSERNFGGSSFCVDEGDSYNSLSNWNDRIRSVEIYGGARVDLCSDRSLNGACITLRTDTGRLPSQIDRRVSSLDVY